MREHLTSELRGDVIQYYILSNDGRLLLMDPGFVCAPIHKGIDSSYCFSDLQRLRLFVEMNIISCRMRLMSEDIDVTNVWQSGDHSINAELYSDRMIKKAGRVDLRADFFFCSFFHHNLSPTKIFEFKSEFLRDIEEHNLY